jgi:hypothetical protein
VSISSELLIRDYAKRLKLPAVASSAERLALEAAAAGHGHLVFLAALLAAEVSQRESNVCVFPVPGGPTASTTSRRSIQAPRASSATSGALSEGTSEKSKSASSFSSGKRAALIRACSHLYRAGPGGLPPGPAGSLRHRGRPGDRAG